MVQEAGAGPAARRLRMGRCLEQQVADLGQGRADHEPALGLGGGGARRAQGRRAVLDPSLAKGSEGPVRSRQSQFLGDLEILGQQGGGEESVDASLAALLGRSSWSPRSHGYDIPPFAKLHDFKTWEEEGPPKGTIYNYPPRGDVDRLDLRRAGADADRQPDLRAGDDDQDDRALHARPASRSTRRWIGPPASSKASCGHRPRSQYVLE